MDPEIPFRLKYHDMVLNLQPAPTKRYNPTWSLYDKTGAAWMGQGQIDAGRLTGSVSDSYQATGKIKAREVLKAAQEAYDANRRQRVKEARLQRALIFPRSTGVAFESSQSGALWRGALP